MAENITFDAPMLQIRAVGNEGSFPTVREITAFMYDWNLLYEILRLATDPQYEDFKFSSRIGYRNGRNRLRARDQFHIESLRIESPLDMVTILHALNPFITGVSILALVQTLEKVYSLKANNRLRNAQAQELEDKHRRAPYEERLAKAQAEKAERENRQAARKEFEEFFSYPFSLERVFQVLDERGALKSYSSTVTRLENSRVRLVTVEVDLIEPGNERPPSPAVPPPTAPTGKARKFRFNEED